PSKPPNLPLNLPLNLPPNLPLNLPPNLPLNLPLNIPFIICRISKPIILICETPHAYNFTRSMYLCTGSTDQGLRGGRRRYKRKQLHPFHESFIDIYINLCNRFYNPFDNQF
ncbi:hypothetical protein PCH_Pc30g00010, partial [Penicillium rubens Wisconsin 54-1255]